MKYKGLWSRWYRYDKNGIKHIKKFKIDEIPSPNVDEGFTEWVRGTGPLAPQHRRKIAIALRSLCLGVPKTEEQKQKMREAKLGVPKSLEHRENMRKAWVRRRNQVEINV